jgi:crotonobetainyl-CoA:carnitine CoA-transferase CaiB-like acyl-CoA transferase
VHNPRGASGGWEKFVGVAGRPDLVTDPRFATGKERRANAGELAAELDAAFAQLPFDEIARRLDEADLVWAAFQTPAEVDADPQIAAAGGFVEVDDGQGGTYRSPASPAVFPGEPTPPRPRAPRLGEHTREVLAEIGYSESEIEAIFAAEGAA